MLSDEDIVNIIKQEEVDAESYIGEESNLNSLRYEIMQYYNQELYGNEEEDESQIVTSEVFQVTEGMIPPLMRFFLQNRNTAEFKATRKETRVEKLKRYNDAKRKAMTTGDKSAIDNFPTDIFEEEAKQKTALANHIFTKENPRETILYNMIKDGLLAITGWVQTYYEEAEEKKVFEMSGLSELEVEFIRSEKGVEISTEVSNEDGTIDLVIEQTIKVKKIIVENCPPEECIVSRRARNFNNPDLIGQKMLKTRSEIRKMNLASKEVIDNLQNDYTDESRVKQARHGIYGENAENLRRNDDPSGDKLWLRRYFMMVDVNEDGIAELWEFFYCDNTLLRKKRVDFHPYSVFVPIPISHKAVGTSPIVHMYKYQFWMSTLVRQMNNNIYTTNYPRYFLSQAVNMDDFYAPKSGGGVRVKGSNVSGAAENIPVDNQVESILRAIEFVQSMIEKTTGVTAYNQGMDTESLNKTATGFVGIRDMSMMRTEVIGRHAAVTIEDIFNKIIKIASNHQDEEIQIMANGEELTINPMKWSDKSRCVVDVGLGAGERREIIESLGFMLEQAKYMIENGLPVADAATIYKIIEKLAVASGQKTIEEIFNNPERPEETVLAENEQLKKQIQQLEAIVNQRNPLLEVEKLKAQAAMMKQKVDTNNQNKERLAKMSLQQADHANARRIKEMELMFDREELKTDTAVELTRIQSQTDKNVKGDNING